MENKNVNKKDKKDKKDKKEKKKEKTPKQQKADLNESINSAYVEIKNNAWNFSIVFLIVVMVILCIYFQYKNEKSLRTSVNLDDGEEDYYDILGVEPNSDLATIRKKYKELTKIWHPDKNPGCKACHDKFLQISKAHEILTDEAKKGEIDSKGGKNIFGSKPVSLNMKNYHHLVEESNDFWVIVIYENTRGNQHNQYMAEVLDEVASRYKNIVKFGVIDVLHNENLLHFLPYKFQYYPNVITYLHGEGSELFQNIESYSVKTLAQFIEESYVSKVNMIDDYTLSNLLANKDQEKQVTSLKYGDLEVKLILLSAKSYIELASKDFAKNYENVVQVYQNEMGYLDKFQKLLNSKPQHRVFIKFNDIVTSDKDKVTLKKTLQPLPFIFKPNSHTPKLLQRAFNLVKYLTLQRIYSNNYSRHCINKISVTEESPQLNENETIINMCIISLEHSNDLNTNAVNAVFYQSLINNFRKNSNLVEHPKQTHSEDYLINVNYGVANLEKNKKLNKLFESFIEEKKIQVPKENSKLFFIVNDTQEKFTFKWFKDENSLKEYLEEFDKADFFEDSQFSFDYFANYHVLEIREIFNEEKIFSLEKILRTSFYAQMQPAYILSFLLIFLLNLWYLKIQNLTPIAIVVSITISLLWQIYNSFNF